MRLENILITVEIVAVILAVIVFAFIIFILYKRIKHFINRLRFDREGLDRKKIVSQWQQIEQLLEQPGEMGHKLAVIEADKLLDEALKTMFMPGESMGQRLKFACHKYEPLRRVWWAHKIRNQLSHELTFRLDRKTAERAVREFKKALEVLGAL